MTAHEQICEKRVYRIDRREVHYLKFVLEGYDGLAVMKTLDPDNGVIAISVAPGCEQEVDMILQDLRKDMRIEVVKDTDENGR